MKVLKPALTELESPHLTGRLSHFFPPARGNIQQLEKQLSVFGLVLPTFSQKTSIDYDAYIEDRDNEYSAELRQMNNNGVGYIRTAVLFDSEGMYAIDLDCISGLDLINLNDLKAGLNGEKVAEVQFSKDRKSAFASYETIIFGKQKPTDLAKNGGVIALARYMSQVEKQVKVAEQFSYSPYFNALKVSQGVERRFVGLDSNWGGSGLDGNCYCRGVDACGFASGVRKTS